VLNASKGLDLVITREFSPPHPWTGVMHCETYEEYQPEKDAEKYLRVWRALDYEHCALGGDIKKLNTTSSPVLKSPPAQ